ncbi:MAG: hypothetical protein WAK17_18945 [Candidatus Nitrosopolaris sp.]
MTWSCWPGNIRLLSFAATFVRLWKEVKTEYDTLEVREAEKAEARISNLLKKLVSCY